METITWNFQRSVLITFHVRSLELSPDMHLQGKILPRCTLQAISGMLCVNGPSPLIPRSNGQGNVIDRLQLDVSPVVLQQISQLFQLDVIQLSLGKWNIPWARERYGSESARTATSSSQEVRGSNTGELCMCSTSLSLSLPRCKDNKYTNLSYNLLKWYRGCSTGAQSEAADTLSTTVILAERLASRWMCCSRGLWSRGDKRPLTSYGCCLLCIE